MNKRVKAVGPVDRLIGDRIKFRRTQLGCSQEKLGAALGLTFQQIQKYERGMNRVSCSALIRIAHALQVSPAWFLDQCQAVARISGAEFGVPQEIIDAHTFMATKGGIAIASTFPKLTPNVQAATIALIAAAAEQPSTAK